MTAQLRPGETGCLASGQTFDDPIGLGAWIIKNVGGEGNAPITIRSSDPSHPARVKAAVWVQGTAHDLIFSDLVFFDSYTGVKGNMIQIEGDRIEIRDSDISYPGGICIGVGKIDQSRTLEDQTSNPDPAFGPPQKADGFVLSGSRVHGCGSALTQALTRQDSGVHGVYLIHGSEAQVSDNYIYGNVNRGVQLYPRVDHALIERNVLDGNGSNLHISASSAPGSGHLSHDNTVRNNLITNAVLRAADPGADWPQGDTHQVFGCCFGGTPRGPNEGDTFGNLVTGNCIHHQDPNRNFGGWGYAQAENVFADPGYADPGNGNYATLANGPCAGIGPRPREPIGTPPVASQSGNADCVRARRLLLKSWRGLKRAQRGLRLRPGRRATHRLRKATRRHSRALTRERIQCSEIAGGG